MFENDIEASEDAKTNSKPPYLFLIPVALGIVGFIGFQTVHMGMGTSVERSSYTDTSLVQATDVQNGVITVHAHRISASRPVQHVAMNVKHAKHEASPTAAPSAPPSTGPSSTPTSTPEPKASPTKAAEKKTAAQPHAKAHRDRQDPSEGDQIAADPVPQIERPISAHLASSVAPGSGEAATAPPVTDAPMVRHETAAVAQATAAPAPAATAKPVEVAVAAPAGPVNASDRIVDAKMSYAAAPEYPDIARDQGVRGTSVVFVTVDSHGSIVHMSIASSSGNVSLDRAALTAARSSQYLAPKVDGKPAMETYRVTYDFAP